MALKVAGQCCAYLARAALLVVALVFGIWPLTAAGMQLGTAKNFNPTTINSGQISILTIRFINPDPVIDASLLQFSDNFPAGMTIAPGPQTNTCGGSLTVAPGSISLANGIVVANGGSCAVSVTVTATAPVTTTLTNVTSAIICFSAQGCSGKTPSANLVVIVLVAPSITSAPPPSGTVGAFYAHQVTASGSPVPTFSASGLPPGLSFSPATNQIVGTPTLAGTFVTTIVASNGVAPDDTQNYTISISNPLGIAIPGGGSTLPGGSAGKPYGPATFTGSGGTPPYTWSACNQPLPPGLALSAGGTLSGTPTQAGSFTFDVCLKDSLGAAKAQTITLVVVTVNTAMSVTVAPNPAVSSVPVVVAATVTGASVAATGLVQFWVAGTGTKCPKQFAAGTPADPDATMRTAPLDANGRAQLTYANLRIDDYLVCAQYDGDGLYPPASAGPVSLAVIKGFFLPPPAVTLVVPAQVPSSAKIDARIMVSGTEGMPVPQGIVRVRVAENEIANANLVDGSAVISIGMPPVGVVTLVADYAGDGLYPPASSDSAVVLVGDVLAAPAGAANIPTLSEWVLGMLALILAVFGLRRLRSR